MKCSVQVIQSIHVDFQINKLILVEQTSVWSEWTPIRNPISNDLLTEIRTEYVCSMSSSANQQKPEIKSEKINYRICNHQDKTDCQLIGLFNSKIKTH